MWIHNALVVFTFGLPAVVLSVIFPLAGMFTRKPLWLVIGGLFALGPAYYLSGGLHLPIYFAPGWILGPALLVYKQKIQWAWIMLTPLILAGLVVAFQLTRTLLLQS